MISDGTYEEFECALSLDKHFLETPIALPCGHSVCRNCIPKGPNQKIVCKVCGVKTDRNILNDKESIGLRKAIQRNIGNLIEIIEKQMNNSLSLLKS